eukprot:5812976-Prymnesium_polylepis.2
MLGLGSRMQPWAGGVAGAELRRGGDLPEAAAIASATVSTAAFFGGGGWAAMHAGKFIGVGLSIDPTGVMEVGVAAELVAAWAGERPLKGALELGMAIPSATASEQAALDARAVLYASVAKAVGALSEDALHDLAGRVASLKRSGMWASDAALGGLLRSAAAAAPDDGLTPKRRRIAELEAVIAG